MQAYAPLFCAAVNRKRGTCHVDDTDASAALIREGLCAQCRRCDTAGCYVAAKREAGGRNRLMQGCCR